VSRLEQPRTARTDAAGATAARSPLFSALVGLAGVGVLLQGVWAGMFIREGQDNSDMWVEVHARGAEVTIVLALLAAVVAVLRLRSRPVLVVGSLAFLVLLVAESYVGGLVGDQQLLEVVHFPLAMALLGLAVYLPVAAARPRR
jgi:hypothetical protein